MFLFVGGATAENGHWTSWAPPGHRPDQESEPSPAQHKSSSEALAWVQTSLGTKTQAHRPVAARPVVGPPGADGSVHGLQ
eukprot:9453480-Pyramimonas_sp.AAC.1